ncbi:MAG: hypothetical protein E7479_04850 [Ruminococcaceae bacterium]|nr:hypothetical protein [Oscillospiraceae bacterium]
MKKALALVLALVLALSMGVSAFALSLVELDKVPSEEAGKDIIPVVDAYDTYLHLYDGGKYYVALDDQPWEDVKVTANGCVSAKLVEFDPEKMVIVDEDGNDIVLWAVTEKGVKLEGTYDYEGAKAAAKAANAEKEVTYYGITCVTNVNVIELVIEDNYTAHFEEGTVKIEAKLDKVPYAGQINVINDVVIFEYEEVKWTAANYAEKAYLTVGQGGYSDWYTSEVGYSVAFDDYDENENRVEEGAAVVSTTAFRAIEGKSLKVSQGILNVTLKAVEAGQKGVNFLGYVDYDYKDRDGDGVFDVDYDVLEAINFGYLGNQVVKGEFVIDINLGLNWYELRELFSLKVEEDDIISYYLIDENGKVVGGKEVDYMTADLTEVAKFSITDANATLGEYSLVLEVPAVEGGESNPNTGAESVVGVVAALAVVSVATAAAVSLKK